MMKISDIISDYLRDNKRLVIPQLGAFIVKASGETIFSELLRRDDGVLRGLIAATGLSELEAAGAADRFVFDIRHVLQRGDAFTIEGVGSLQYGQGEAIVFTPAPKIAAEPQQAEDEQVAAAADETPQTAAEDAAQVQPAAAETADGEPDKSVRTSAAEGGQNEAQRLAAQRRAEQRYVRGLRYPDRQRFDEKAGAFARRGSIFARMDKFLLLALLAAVLAVSAIIYGYVRERRTRQIEIELFGTGGTESADAQRTDTGADGHSASDE